MVLTKATKVHRLTSKELYNFKVLVFFVFLVYGLILPLWFAFYGDTFLHDKERWADIVLSKTRTARSEYDESKRVNDKKNNIIKKRKTSNENIKKSYPKPLRRAPPVLPKRFSKARGRLLSMRWNVCCQSINCLRKYPLFPLIPDKTGFLRNLRVFDSHKLYGQRITGRLSPPKTGNYSFVMNCMHATCELWLGLNEYPLSSRIVLKVVNGSSVALGNDSSAKYTNTERLKQFFEAELSSSKTYFIDIIFTVYRPLRNPIEVLWKLPNAHKYTLITTKFLAGFSKKPTSLSTSLNVFSRAPSVRLSPFLETIEEQGEDDDDFKIIGGEARKDDPFFDEKGKVIPINTNLLITGSLPVIHYRLNVSFLKHCLYSPSFLVNSSLPKYVGVWRTSFSSVFPRDNTGRMMCIGNRYPEDCQGNTVVSRETVHKLLRLYTRALNKYSTRYKESAHFSRLEKQSGIQLSSLVNIEEKIDPLKGSRFLLEIILTDPGSNSKYFHSDYVYMNKNGTSLCSPIGFTVDLYTTVNVVVVAKRQSRWLRHFLANMEKIYINTNDKHLNIIIAKYGMDDDNLMDEYERNRLPNIRTVRHFGVFHKAKAIQSAVDTIQDPNGIIFLMDLHILAPETIISLVRKHTIRGKVVFNPVLFRLSHCGSPASRTKPSRGFWETFGYGILGIYKSDWNRIGGMSLKKHSRGWGGEDWELLGRVLSAGLEIERLRVPNFYHFYHSKKNMWN